MLWTKVKSEAARGDGGWGFAGLPRVVSDELKEASEQGGAAIRAEREAASVVGAEWMGDTGLGAEKGFGGSCVFTGCLWSLVPRWGETEQ